MVLDQPSDGAGQAVDLGGGEQLLGPVADRPPGLRGERAADDEKGEGLMGDEYDDMLDAGLTTEDGLAEAFGMDTDN
ncbi:MAG TPA: hypothetical protein VGD71_38990 [Kribbella sp.]|jgi:hypothetical protein